MATCCLAVRAPTEARAFADKFSPGNSAYSAGVGDVSYPAWVEEMTPEQRAVMEKPSIRRSNL